MKRVWRKNFEIKNNHPLTAYEALPALYDWQTKTLGQKVFDQIIWISKNQDIIGAYWFKDDMRKIIDLTLKKIISQPEFFLKIQKETARYNDQFFRLLHQARKTNLVALNNKELLSLYQKAFRLLQLSHIYSIYSTWFIDSDGEDLAIYLLNQLKKRVNELGLKVNLAEVFSLLTTPTKPTMAQVENIESLKILQLIQNKQKAKRLFQSNDLIKIESGLADLTPALRHKIINHYQRWQWTPYGYIGPAYNLDYYLDVWRGLLKQKINIAKELKQQAKVGKEIGLAKEKLFKKLQIKGQDKTILDLAADIVWLKAYRKDSMFFGMFIMDKIYKEIGKRCNLSLNQARHLSYEEVKSILTNDRRVAVAELNERAKFFVAHLDRGKLKILTGKAAKSFLARQNFEKVVIADVKELTGTPAYPGKVKGIVKIVNVADEMNKIEKNNIMVAHTTFPALVPAMKKASAIVTDDGGLTCHAAIVARELKKPCVVGTKIATSALKDGDKVMVDATNGVVRKINSKS